VLRELMTLHTQGIDDQRECVSQALAITDFLHRFQDTRNGAFAAYLKKEIESFHAMAMDPERWSYLFHEYLEPDNQPIYFRAFAAHADRFGLQYLGEAAYSRMMSHGFPQAVHETVQSLSEDIVVREQYMDFLRNRRFRQSLICRAGIPLNQDVPIAGAEGFLFSCPPDMDEALVEQAPVSPIAQKAIRRLMSVSPAAMPFEELASRVRQDGGRSESRTESAFRMAREDVMLIQDLFFLLSIDLVRIHTWQADFVTHVSARPKAHPLARYLIRDGRPWLVNACHESIPAEGALSGLLPLLDGERDIPEIASRYRSGVEAGEFSLEHAEIVPDAQAGADLSRVWLDRTHAILRDMARKALLVG